MEQTATPDLAGAEVYIEAGRPIAHGRWYIRNDDVVIYQRPSGAYEPSIIAVHTLRSSPTWKLLSTEPTQRSDHGLPVRELPKTVATVTRP